MKSKTIPFFGCAVLTAALLFSAAGCTQKLTEKEETLPVFAPVEDASTASASSDPLALILPHDTLYYDVPPLSAARTLEPFGTITDTSRRIGFYADGTLRETAKVNGVELYYLLDRAGERLSSSPYLAATPVTDTVFAVTADSSSVNRVGLVSTDGTVLLPCEAAAILSPENADGLTDPRFVEVIYAEGRTDNAADAFFVRAAGETETYYTGYALLYDLVLGRFVPHIRLTGSAARRPSASSDRIAVRDAASGSVVLYTPDGLSSASFSRLDGLMFGRDSFLAYSDGEYRVYESDTTATYVSSSPLDYIAGEGRYFTEQTEDGAAIIDRFGNRLFDEAFAEVVCEYGGVIHAVKTNGKRVLCDLHGTHLYETDAGNAMKHLSRGIYASEDGSVILPDGSTVIAGEGDPDRLIFVDGTNAFVFGDRSFSLALPSDTLYAVGEALAAVRDGREYVLYDLYGANELLRGGYGIIASAYGCIYARRGDTVDVYTCVPHETADDAQSLQNVNTQ